MFDEQTRDASRRQPPGLRRRLRRPRRRRRAHGRGGAAAVRPPRAGGAQPRRSADRAAALLQGARRRRAHRGADLADQRAPVHDDGRHLGGVRPRRGGAEAVHRQAARRRWTSAIDVASGSSARSCAELDRLLRGLLGRDRASCAARCPTSTRRSRAAPASSAACRSSTTKLEGTFAALEDLTSAPSTNAAHARADRDGHDAQPAAALLRPVRHGLQRLELLLDLPRRALLRARLDRPVPARAAQHRPAARTTRSARWAPTSRPTARRSSRATRSTCTATPTAPRSPPTGARTARPASAATSSATPRFYDKKFKIEQDARTPGAQGPTYTGPRPRARGPDLHRDPGDRRVREDPPVLER